MGGSAANVSVTDSTIDRFTATPEGMLRGGLSFQACRFLPRVIPQGGDADLQGDANLGEGGDEPIYALNADLGTHLTNCVAHAPRVAGELRPELADRLHVIQPNKRVRYNQLNTALGNDFIQYFKVNSIQRQPNFIAMLKSHHGLETDQVPAANQQFPNSGLSISGPARDRLHRKRLISDLRTRHGPKRR